MLQSPFTRKGNFPSSRPLPRKEGKKTYVKEKKLYNLTELVTSVLTKHHLCCARIPPDPSATPFPQESYTHQQKLIISLNL